MGTPKWLRATNLDSCHKDWITFEIRTLRPGIRKFDQLFGSKNTAENSVWMGIDWPPLQELDQLGDRTNAGLQAECLPVITIKDAKGGLTNSRRFIQHGIENG
jgi:hypothetical protein